jgi:predicted short-subunit dehydrogenase-like oxidoreductase (DUF2520 family)
VTQFEAAGSVPRVGIVGAGRVGTVLALVLARAGWHVTAVASRDAGRRERISGLVPGAAVGADPAAVARAADIVLLTVPDDAIVEAAGAMRFGTGLVVAHTSGAHPAGILRPAVPEGSAVGAFHPLIAFADLERATNAIAGAWVAIDGDTGAVTVLEDMARGLGARPVVLRPGPDPTTTKAAYHAAAVLAAGGFVALLDAITALGGAAGMDEATALEVYGSLIRQGLANSAALGVAGSLTGPIVREDLGTLRRHLDAIAQVAPDVRDLYLAAARRQLAIAERRGGLDDDRALEMARLLEA